MDPTHSISSRAPVVRQSVDSYHEQLQTEKESFVCTDGVGFDQAKFTLTGEESYLKDWFVNGLVRDIKWRASDGSTAWEGYVSRVILTLGGDTVTKSVEGMYNRIVYVYAPLDTTPNPPTVGAQTIITKNDTDSQDLYGIKAKVISGNEATAATADDEAYAQLANLRFIREGRSVAVGVGKTPMLQVECKGYAYMLDWSPYTQTANTGTDNASVLIYLIANADLNSVISTDAALIDTNTTQIQEYWNGQQTSWKIIQDIAERGYEAASVGFRWTVGVYEGRRIVYKAAEALDANGVPESTNKWGGWYRNPFEAGDNILDGAGDEIMPWAVRPDRLLYTNGVPGRPTYIKQVTFTAPFTVVISGEDALNPMRAPDSREPDPELVTALRAYFYPRDREITTLLPLGIIVLWSGAIVDIPTGWALCDGAGGTPDLRDFFVIGAGSTYAVDASGGSATKNLQHNHGGNTGAGTAHNHGGNTGAGAAHSHASGTLGADSPASSCLVNGPLGTEVNLARCSHSHGVSGNTGNESTHTHSISNENTHTHSISNDLAVNEDVLNPYYALAYIQRTG